MTGRFSPELRIEVDDYDIQCVGDWCTATFRGQPYVADWMESGRFLPCDAPRVIDELNKKIAETKAAEAIRKIGEAAAIAK